MSLTADKIKLSGVFNLREKVFQNLRLGLYSRVTNHTYDMSSINSFAQREALTVRSTSTSQN